MIRFLQESEKQNCRALWEEAFPEDSAAFCDYYFQEKMRDNRVLVSEDAGEIQAMLHLNPYRLAVNGQKWRIDYIVGVATRLGSRRKGYMKGLLSYLFQESYEEEVPFVYLMPAAAEIYQPYDFVYIFDQPVWKLKEPNQLVRQTVFPVEERGSQLESGQVEGFGWRKRMIELAGWVNHWLEQSYQVYAIRDEAYLDRLGKELLSEDGKMELLYDGGRMAGVSASWGISKPEQRVLYCQSGYCEETDQKQAIMARIVHLPSFLKAIHLKKSSGLEEVQIRLRIIDSWIPENDGLWIWHLTREMSWAEREEQQELTAAEIASGIARTITPEEHQTLELSIADLTGWLFGYDVPNGTEPFEALVQTLQGVFLDEMV